MKVYMARRVNSVYVADTKRKVLDHLMKTYDFETPNERRYAVSWLEGNHLSVGVFLVRKEDDSHLHEFFEFIEREVN